MNILQKIFGNKETSTNLQLSVGDVIYSKNNEKYYTYKILDIEENGHPQMGKIYHVLNYQDLDSPPKTDDIPSLQISVYHCPIGSFPNCTLLGKNIYIKPDELSGYHEYIKIARSVEYLVEKASAYYREGCSLNENKNPKDAIDAYTKAIDLHPLFWEAIDNRAFSKMDLGLFQEAITDFELSLQKNPNGFAATFSIGECYFKLKDYENATKYFLLAQKIDPNDPGLELFLSKIPNP